MTGGAMKFGLDINFAPWGMVVCLTMKACAADAADLPLPKPLGPEWEIYEQRGGARALYQKMRGSWAEANKIVLACENKTKHPCFAEAIRGH